MRYRFIIKPEPDACKRCIREAFTGEDGKGHFRIHQVESRDERVVFNRNSGLLRFTEREGDGRTGLIHPLCRCQAHVVEVYDQSKDTVAFVHNRHYDTPETIDDADSEENVDRKANSDRDVRERLATHPSHLRAGPGKKFSTIVSEVLTLLFNRIFGLKNIGRSTDDR